MAAGDISIWRSLFSLLVILGAMWAAYRWLRRHRGISAISERRMKVLERLPLDARRSILLLRIDDELVVVSISGEQVSLLKTLKPVEQGDED